MTNLTVDLAEPGGGSRGLLAEAWAEHVESARHERQGALATLTRLELALERWARANPPEQVLRRILSLRVPVEAEPRVVRGLAAACAAIAVLAASNVGLATVAGERATARLFGPGHRSAVERFGPLGPEDRAAALAAGALVGGPAVGRRTPVAAALPPIVPAARGALPVGKGMWMWRPEAVEGGNPEAVVQRARAAGLTHIYVRTGSSRSGFHAPQYLNDLLPRAHRVGIRVYGWDFPYLENVQADVDRAVEAITFRAPGGHRIDGFTADIETRREGVNITAAGAAAYGAGLRAAVGVAYPLIATVPRPSAALVTYPFPEVVAAFDAIAPMVYWMNRDSGGDVAGAITFLRQFNKPIIPVGQAYDGFAEGGPPGVPSRASLQRFIKVADEFGALGVSFWSWQHADQQAWDAIRDAPEFTLPATPLGSAVGFTPGQIRMYQGLLTSLGFPVAVTGRWNDETARALRTYQSAARLPTTGVVDEATRVVLLTPFSAPVARKG